MRTFLACFLLIASIAAAQAQSMLEMKAEAQRKFEQADTELNTVYRKVIASLSESGATALKEAQRAWLTARDKTAEASGSSEEGGSLQGLAIIQCREALTRHRTKELQELFLDQPK